jgi:polyhydroxyalkanoate synthesis regulator phasin
MARKELSDIPYIAVGVVVALQEEIGRAAQHLVEKGKSMTPEGRARAVGEKKGLVSKGDDFSQVIARTVQRVLENTGVVTRGDLEELDRRISVMETRVASGKRTAPGGKAGGKKAAGRKPAKKPSAGKKASEKKEAKKPSAGKKASEKKASEKKEAKKPAAGKKSAASPPDTSKSVPAGGPAAEADSAPTTKAVTGGRAADRLILKELIEAPPVVERELRPGE